MRKNDDQKFLPGKTGSLQAVLLILLGTCCIAGTGLGLMGCVDQRQDPRQAKLGELTRNEWASVQNQFLQKEPTPQYRLDTTLSIREGGRDVPALYVYGVDVNPSPVERGKQLTLTYYFKPLRRFSQVWGIFLHVEGGPEHRYYLNQDHHPIQGLYPSTRWLPHRIFRSSHTFVLPREFPGQQVYLFSGFWQGNDRMIVSTQNDGNNRLRLAVVPVRGKGLQKPVYVAYRIVDPPRIDGRLDEPMWKHLPSTGSWPTYNNQKARFETWARLAWDEKYLYVGIYCQDDDIWSTYTKRDDPIFNQEVVEFFIDANRNHRDYIELQVSPAGVIFDSFFPRYRWPKPWGQLDYDSKMVVQVHREGTLNNPKDVDRFYSVEMRLELSRLGPAINMPPKNGDEWLINFYRFERSRRTPGEAQAWSPVTLSSRGGDFHQISRFGTLRFSTQTLRFPHPSMRVIQTPQPAHQHHAHDHHGHAHHGHDHGTRTAPQPPRQKPTTQPRAQGTTSRPQNPTFQPRLYRPTYRVVPNILRPRLYTIHPGENKSGDSVHSIHKK